MIRGVPESSDGGISQSAAFAKLDEAPKFCSADQVPAVKAWFKRFFPHMSEPDLNRMTEQWVKNEMHYLNLCMSKIREKQKKAAEEFKKSISGE